MTRHRKLNGKIKTKQKLTSAKILKKWYVHLLLHQRAFDQRYTNFPRDLKLATGNHRHRSPRQRFHKMLVISLGIWRPCSSHFRPTSAEFAIYQQSTSHSRLTGLMVPVTYCKSFHSNLSRKIILLSHTRTYFLLVSKRPVLLCSPLVRLGGTWLLTEVRQCDFGRHTKVTV